MKSETRNLGDLLETVVARQDEQPIQPVVERARSRVFSEVPYVRKKKPKRKLLLLAAAALLSTLCVTWWVIRSSDAALHYEVAGKPSTAGAWLVASDNKLPVHFSNGTELLLHPDARGRVQELRPYGATVELAKGHLAVSVPHTANGDWSFLAGPFAVEVTGTRFDLRWNAQRETLDIALFEGSVEVHHQAHPPQRVVAGQRLRLYANEPLAEDELDAGTTASNGTPAQEHQFPPDPLDGAEKLAAPQSSGIARGPTTAEQADASTPGWRTLAQSGEYSAALSRAETMGFNAEVARAGAADLLLLGDASRYAGNTSRARQCYRALRDRFAGTLEGSRALFRLGVLAFPSTEAISYFENFLRERPSDPLASEALGRIVEAHHRATDTAQARAAAQRYLARYPQGAHAKLARKIIDR